jgi:hypothetical protein
MAFTSVLGDPCGGKVNDDIANGSILYLVLCLLFAKDLFCSRSVKALKENLIFYPHALS